MKVSFNITTFYFKTLYQFFTSPALEKKTIKKQKERENSFPTQHEKKDETNCMIFHNTLTHIHTF